MLKCSSSTLKCAQGWNLPCRATAKVSDRQGGSDGISGADLRLESPTHAYAARTHAETARRADEDERELHRRDGTRTEGPKPGGRRRHRLGTPRHRRGDGGRVPYGGAAVRGSLCYLGRGSRVTR